jgi:hypothetical protein
VFEAKFEDFEDSGSVSKERFRSGSIRSRSGDEWRILGMHKNDNDADLHTQSIAMRISEAAVQFEKDHYASIRDYNFLRGQLVLMHNSQVEMSLNSKMQP